MARTLGLLLTEKVKEDQMDAMSPVVPMGLMEEEAKEDEEQDEEEVEDEDEDEVEVQKAMVENQLIKEESGVDQLAVCKRKTTRCRRIASWLSWKAKTPFWRRVSRLAHLPKPGGAVVNQKKRWVISHRRAVTRSQVRELSSNVVSNIRKLEEPPNTNRGLTTRVQTSIAVTVVKATATPKQKE